MAKTKTPQEQVNDLYNQIRDEVLNGAADIQKLTDKGNQSAGVRVRKMVKTIQTAGKELRKLSLECGTKE